MAQKLYFVHDGATSEAATSEVVGFAVATGTKTSRRALPAVRPTEWAQLVVTDGGTGDTADWGVRSAMVYAEPVEEVKDV